MVDQMVDQAEVQAVVRAIKSGALSIKAQRELEDAVNTALDGFSSMRKPSASKIPGAGMAPGAWESMQDEPWPALRFANSPAPATRFDSEQRQRESLRLDADDALVRRVMRGMDCTALQQDVLINDARRFADNWRALDRAGGAGLTQERYVEVGLERKLEELLADDDEAPAR